MTNFSPPEADNAAKIDFVIADDWELRALIDNGIRVDVTIAAGLYYDTGHKSLDCRDVDEPFAPYYPRLDDARRVADEPQPIVAAPTHSFRRSRIAAAQRRLARKLRGRPRARTAEPAGRRC